MKFPLVLFFSLFFFSNDVFAQTDLKIMIGPKWSGVNSSNDFGTVNKSKLYTGFDISAVVLFRADKRLQIYGGIGASTIGDVTEVGFNNLRWGDQYNGNTGVATGTTIESTFESAEKYKFKSIFLMAELPLGINYFFKETLSGFYLDGSLKPSYALDVKNISIKEFKDGTREVNRTEPIGPDGKKFNVNAKVGLGYQFSKFQNFNLMIYGETQTLNWGLNGFNYSHYSMGISVGIRL